jgi:hypothetical protein
MAMLLVEAACPCHISMQHVHASCPCSMSLLNAVCPCCKSSPWRMSMLQVKSIAHVQDACQVHGACPGSMSLK